MILSVEHRISALVALGDKITKAISSGEWEGIFLTAKHKNPWFTIENTRSALSAIATSYLDSHALQGIVEQYSISDDGDKKTIGMVLAGNLPAVGFHDLICAFLTGHTTMVKLSSKDDVIIPLLLEQLYAHDELCRNYFQVVERLKGYDAVVATGGNNTSRYFTYYFKDVPNIIRKSRNGVAVLDGTETEEEIDLLGKDVFSFFGLGCRNVSKLYVPQGYDVTRLLARWETLTGLQDHNKYRNNYDYNMALFLLNKKEFLTNGNVLLLEEKQIASRIASLHYEYYDPATGVTDLLIESEEQIQCIIGKESILGVRAVPFGRGQMPAFTDYADGVDTVAFMKNL